MPIKWADTAALERVIAALLAAHPDLSPNYRDMAVYYGQEASYDSLQTRFRHYRHMADKMLEDAGTTPSRRRPGLPSTPRTNRGGVAKPKSSKKSQAQQYEQRTPTKMGKMRNGTMITDAIVLDDEDDIGEISFKNESSPRERKVKMENTTANVNTAVKHEPVAAIDLEPFILAQMKNYENRTQIPTNPYVDVKPDENHVQVQQEIPELDNNEGLMGRKLHKPYSSMKEWERDFGDVSDVF